MELHEILIIVSSALGLIAIFFSARWAATKKLIKELAEVLVAISEAIEDDNITNEEVVDILKECVDVAITAKELFKK